MSLLCQYNKDKEGTSLLILEQARKKGNVTLDPDTAHPNLVLSNDLKRVRWESRKQELPDNPERFDWEPFVLGPERFTSGRHWWEVEVEETKGMQPTGGVQASVRRKGDIGQSPNEGRWETEELAAQWEIWAVGVARESIIRKGKINLDPNGGFWALGKALHDSLRTPFSPYQLTAFTSPTRTLLSLRHEPRKIRVFLDYEESRVDFFDGDTNDLIFTFPSFSFNGERLCPFFWVYWGATCANVLYLPGE
ncbi:butyrophilin subfamily 1 member A1-like [Elgaria multicarinata webbii]|uniref:butyrophilin subfamily 1 member A1-like n=1 Tax=Elgaria multicarinata webbii TaxID=159646 RepID=UPI002FCD5756